ncbi:MAG: hypothetical protein HY996_09585 [Micrococcales bacterium]|nr:hypothetical protein [Micrococcales bacterium]
MAGVPQGQRTRPRAIIDPRLLLGLMLVLVSVAGVVAIVAFSDRTVAVYAAASPLTPGQRVKAADLVQRQVALDGADRLYLRVGSMPTGGVVMTRPVSDGELLPASSVGDAARSGMTSFVVQVDGRVSEAVAPGATVDVWSSPSPDAVDRSADPPAVVASGATVVQVLKDDGLVARDRVAVEVLVPRARIAQLLQAVSDDQALALVPAGLSLRDGS